MKSAATIFPSQPENAPGDFCTHALTAHVSFRAREKSGEQLPAWPVADLTTAENSTSGFDSDW
jgi:hypothetical protein